MIRLTLPANSRYLNVVESCLAGVLEHAGSLPEPETTIYNVQLAVHEICVNIVKHAYGDRSDGRIWVRICLASDPRRIVIDLRDTGRTFKPADVPGPDLSLPRVHGYGLFLARELLDEVNYRPGSRGNRWRLVKVLEAGG